MPANPSTYPNAVVWQPTLPSLIWKGAVDGSDNVSAVDDLIQNAETEISGRVLNRETGAEKPKWKGDGWYWCGNDGSARRLSIATSTAIHNHFHVSGTGHLLVRFKVDTANNGTTKVIVTNCRFSTFNRGFGLRVQDAGVNFQIWTGVAGVMLSLTHAGPIVSGQEHWCEVIIKAGASQCSINVDGGTPVTGTLGTLSSATNALSNLFIGAQDLGTNPLNGQVRNLLIASQELDPSYVAAWKAFTELPADLQAPALDLGLCLSI